MDDDRFMAGMLTSEVLRSVGLMAGHVGIESVGGATGRSWKVSTADGPFVLRLAMSPESCDREIAAIEAAAAVGLPVQHVVRRSAVGLLLSWAPGVPVADAARRTPELAFDLGIVMGEAQRRMHRAPVPPAGVLLHGDFHVLNVLVDGTSLSGVIDWENATGGDPLTDLARTQALFTVDPALDALPAEDRHVLGRIAAGWAAGYGPEASDIPGPHLAQVGRMMRDDLAHRYADRPEAFARLEAWTEFWANR